MPDEITFHWTGMREYSAALDAMEARAVAATRLAVVEAAAAIEKAAKARAPVESGDLRRSVMTSDVRRAGVGGWEARIGPTVAYGRRVELGFHGTDRRGRTYAQDGQPYLRPAVEELLHTVLPEIFRRNWRLALVRV